MDVATPSKARLRRRGAGNPPRLCARVELVVDAAEMGAGEVGVDFGGADVGVAQHGLNRAQVGAPLDEVGGE